MRVRARVRDERVYRYRPAMADRAVCNLDVLDLGCLIRVRLRVWGAGLGSGLGSRVRLRLRDRDRVRIRVRVRVSGLG